MTLECIELRLEQRQLHEYLDKLEKAEVAYGFAVVGNAVGGTIDLQLHVDGCDSDLKIRLQDGRWYATVLHPVIEMVPAAKKESHHADA